MTMPRTVEIAKYVFPAHEEVTFTCVEGTSFAGFRTTELQATYSRLKIHKAPRPGNVPAEVINQMVADRPEYVLAVMNGLAKI